MFTGIIQRVGTVARVARSGGPMKLAIDAGDLAKRVELGGSVAVDGVCLTATVIAGPQITFDVGAESVSRSTLASFQPGRRVNLELPLAAGDPLGGHIVQGHVDAVGTISSVRSTPDGMSLGISAPSSIMDEMVLKGSVAIDGVSLTISAIEPERFEVYLIPRTLESTTLKHKNVGDRVNLETDIIGKYIAKMLKARESGGVTENKLREYGYM